MRNWSTEPGFEHLQDIARKIEAMAQATNAALLKAAGIEADDALDVVAGLQAGMLRLDDHGRRRLLEKLEEKRVRTFAGGSLVMTCVLCSAVALSEFKHQPRRVGGSLADKALDRLRDRSTTGLGLGAFALATFYAVMGRGAAGRLKARKSRRTIRS